MKKNIFLSVLFLLSNFCWAQDYSDPVAEGEIVIEKPTDLTQSYRDRRNRFGVLFSVNYEKFSPNKYVSILQNKNFKQLSDGSSVPLIGGELGLKFNFTLGSLTSSAGYSQGSYSNDSKDVRSFDVKITKFSLNFALDNLMTEPWVVPYGQLGIHKIAWNEESYDSLNNLVPQSVDTPWAMDYRAGVLFQLNWLENAIDPNTHTNGLTSSGLQNTFLDIYYQSYPETKAEVDSQPGKAVNLQSDNFGVGLKLEF